MSYTAGFGARAQSDSTLHSFGFCRSDFYDDGYSLKKATSNVMAEFFQKEPCLYGASAFRKAATLFEAFCPPVRREEPQSSSKQQEKRGVALEFDFDSQLEKRQILNLVFSTLKCK